MDPSARAKKLKQPYMYSSYPFATRISYLETCPFRSTLEAAFNNSSTSAAIPFPFSNSMVLALCEYQKKHNLTQQEFSEGIKVLSRGSIDNNHDPRDLARRFRSVDGRIRRFLRDSHRHSEAQISDFLNAAADLKLALSVGPVVSRRTSAQSFTARCQVRFQRWLFKVYFQSFERRYPRSVPQGCGLRGAAISL